MLRLYRMGETAHPRAGAPYDARQRAAPPLQRAVTVQDAA
jgi:hypothetical protein